jgi:hypothetical protein
MRVYVVRLFRVCYNIRVHWSELKHLFCNCHNRRNNKSNKEYGSRSRGIGMGWVHRAGASPARKCGMIHGMGPSGRGQPCPYHTNTSGLPIEDKVWRIQLLLT